MQILGVHKDGVFAEYAVFEEGHVLINDPQIPSEYTSLEEPLGNVVDTTRTDNVAVKRIFITGAGPLGLMAVALFGVFGASRIFIS